MHEMHYVFDEIFDLTWEQQKRETDDFLEVEATSSLRWGLGDVYGAQAIFRWACQVKLNINGEVDVDVKSSAVIWPPLPTGIPISNEISRAGLILFSS